MARMLAALLVITAVAENSGKNSWWRLRLRVWLSRCDVSMTIYFKIMAQFITNHSCHNHTFHWIWFPKAILFICYTVGLSELKNVGAKTCLDGKHAGGNERSVYVHPCNNGDNQKWEVHYSNPKTVIRHKVSMFCLSSDYGRPQLEGCKDNRNGRNKDVVQKWTVDGKDGWRTLMENKGQCLETNGTTLFFSNCKETKGENFRRWEERALPW
jgi:hypothetical protein